MYLQLIKTSHNLCESHYGAILVALLIAVVTGLYTYNRLLNVVEEYVS